MNIKLNIAFETNDPVEDAKSFTDELKDKNLRGAKVRQLTTKPKEGELSVVEWFNVIELMIGSGFALGVVKGLFDLLRGRLVELPKAKIESETTKYEIDTNKELEYARMNHREHEIKLDFECGDKKYHFALTKENHAQEDEIIDFIKKLESDCK